MNTKVMNGMEKDYKGKHHAREPEDDQCGSFLVKHIKAPVDLVWSLVRSFDQPQKYKPFVHGCVTQGNLEVGCLRKVNITSGLSATTSTERLELLDDEKRILSVSIIGGDHILKNYSSTISVLPEVTKGRQETLVIESFVMDVPEGQTKEDMCYLAEKVIDMNLKSLAHVSERIAMDDKTESSSGAKK